MKTKAITVAVMLSVVALLVAALGHVRAQDSIQLYLPFLAYVRGDAETGVCVQNEDADEAASVVLDLYPQLAGGTQRMLNGHAAPHAATCFYLPVMPDLSGIYGGIAYADRPIGAIARTDWAGTLGAAMYGAPIPDVDVSLALVTKEYGGQCSVISIQNTNRTSPADAVVDFYKTGDVTSLISREYTVRAGTFVTLRPCEDAALKDALPNGFLGSLRVWSKDGVTDFAVQSFVIMAKERKAVYAFEGVPAEMMAHVLYVPLFRASQKLGMGKVGNTGIAVVNADSSAGDVTVTFRPSQLAPTSCGRDPILQTKHIEANSSVVFWQGRGGSPVPEGCFGSATIAAAGWAQILAVVVDAVDDYQTGRYNITAAAYNAVSLAQAAPLQALPLFRTGHTKQDLWTGVAVMNVGAQNATVSLSVTNAPTGVTIPDAMTVAGLAPNETHIFWPESIRWQGPPWSDVKTAYGSAMVTSDQPVVVIVNDSSGAKDPALQTDAASYVGIPVYRSTVPTAIP
jgi:hypothetical protein